MYLLERQHNDQPPALPGRDTLRPVVPPLGRLRERLVCQSPRQGLADLEC